MKKNIIAIGVLLLATLMLCLGLGLQQNAYALDSSDVFANFTSKSTLLMHADSGQVLYAKNEHEKMQVASITKLMTVLLTLERTQKGTLKLDDEFIATEHACSMEGSQAFLDEGSAYTVKELLKSVIVASANDSAALLAEGIAGSESGFVKLMNEKAKQLKMNNTLYANATGLPATEQYSTAYDTATILKQVGKYDIYNQDSKIWMDKFVHPSGRETELVNTNRLIKYYAPTVSGKTGFTDEAGYCLASTASNKGLNLIAVTLNCADASSRFKESMDLFQYGFANYENKQVLSCDTALQQEIRIAGGKQETIAVYPQENYYVINKKGDDSQVTLNYELKNKVTAPVKQGDVLGKVLVTKQGKVIGEVNVVANQSVEKQTFGSALQKLANNWSF